MNEATLVRIPVGFAWRTGLALSLALMLPACGGAVTSGVAVGQVGHELAEHAHGTPQGADVCVLQEALAAPTSGVEKPTSEACNKAAKNDQLWRRSLVVLGAYADTLETIASGESSDTTGQLEAARTGVHGADWIDVDGAQEKAARDAVVQIVAQLRGGTAKGDLSKAVKDAEPHVKTLCDGLTAYLDAQGRSLADLQRDAEKKRIAHTDRRCGSLDTKTICVSDSAVDHLVYAGLYGHVAALQSSHQEAREAVAGFCAAYAKLAAAAEGGRLSKDQTFTEVVDAINSVPRGPAAPAPAATKPASTK